MTRKHERELESMLSGDPVPAPPADLAAKIVAEIPGSVDLHPNLQSDHDATVVPLRRRRTPWLAAAAAVLTLSLTAAVTWQLRDSGPQPAAVEAVPQPAPGQPPPVAFREQREAAVDADRTLPAEPATAGRSERRPDGAASDDRGTIRDRMVTTGGLASSATDQPATAVDGLSPESRSLLRSAPSSEQVPAPAGTFEEQASASVGSAMPGAKQHIASNERQAGERTAVADTAGAASPQRVSGREHESDTARTELKEEKTDKGAARGGKDSRPNLAPEAKHLGEVVVTAESPVIDTTAIAPSVDNSYFATTTVGAEGRDTTQVIQMVAAPPQAPPSTGGTTEPNDEAYGDMFFRGAGVNPFVDTEDDALSTFGLEVDTGSFNVVRRYLADGNLPPAEAVRVEELVNAFDYGDRPPRRGDFRLTAEGGPTPYTENDRYRLVRFAIKAREVDASRRPPATLVFVIDVSGSMDRENRLGLVKRALAELLAELRPDDRVGLVVYGSRGEVLLDPTSDLERVRRAIDRLHAGGSTNAEEGLVLGYELAADNLQRGRISRVILCSDGVANVGRTGPESILARIQRDVERGIELTAVGFGMGNYNDALMERLADTGDGRYAYVDTLEEARRIFVEELTGTLYTVAREAKAQVEFDPDTVSRWRLLGYENRAIADERFRDPTVDAGEIGAGHTVTALYEVKLADGAGRHDTLATLRVRYRPVQSDEPIELEQRLAVGDLARSWSATSPALRLAASVAELAELLKGAYWARGGSLDTVLETLRGLDRAFGGDPRFDDLVAMARTARALLTKEQPPGRDMMEDDGR